MSASALIRTISEYAFAEFRVRSVTVDGPDGGTKTHPQIERSAFDTISPSLLGLGDVAQESSHVAALAVIFDLEGFTAFCNQVDSHLVVPGFLTQYLQWLFDAIKDHFQYEATGTNITLWSTLPFFAKFMGDGLLFLWDTTRVSKVAVANVIAALWLITQSYQKQLYPRLRREISHTPKRLRCGVARGQILSVGDGNDFVGPCINIAARLQKMPGLTFAVSARGITSPIPATSAFWNRAVLKQVQLRGIGDDERIYAHEDELALLGAPDREAYGDVDGA